MPQVSRTNHCIVAASSLEEMVDPGTTLLPATTGPASVEGTPFEGMAAYMQLLICPGAGSKPPKLAVSHLARVKAEAIWAVQFFPAP